MRIKTPIYLDYMATTPVDPQVVAKMTHYLSAEGDFGNPASNHAYGYQASAAVNSARQQVAASVNADPKEIIWTSGATESNNLALIGAARFYQGQGKHIITVKTEHKSVLDSCAQLAREGFEITYLTPQSNGLLDLQTLTDAIRPNTILVSVMHVNNEIGVIQDIQAISKITRSKGIICHVDAAQGLGKVTIDLQNSAVDLMSFTAHKIYGPKGIGALYVRRKPRTRLLPLIHGGGHENGLRSGTLATHQIVGMGAACDLAQTRFASDSAHISHLRDRLLQGIKQLDGVTINGDLSSRIAGNLSISVAGVEGDSLILALSDLALSTASACNAASTEPSYVLRALGVADELAHSTLRLSIGRSTTAEEIDFASTTICQQIQRLRALAP